MNATVKEGTEKLLEAAQRGFSSGIGDCLDGIPRLSSIFNNGGKQIFESVFGNPKNVSLEATYEAAREVGRKRRAEIEAIKAASDDSAEWVYLVNWSVNLTVRNGGFGEPALRVSERGSLVDNRKGGLMFRDVDEMRAQLSCTEAPATASTG